MIRNFVFLFCSEPGDYQGKKMCFSKEKTNFEDHKHKFSSIKVVCLFEVDFGPFFNVVRQKIMNVGFIKTNNSEEEK